MNAPATESPIEREEVSDAALRELFESTGTIAVVGMKNDEKEDAYRVPRYMQEQGHRILPVNPKLASAGEAVLGEAAFASLGAIEEPVDLVNLFRAPEHIPPHVDEILALSPRPRAVWMQLGIVHGGAAARLRAEGIQVIQDRCIMVDHRRVMAG